MLKRRLIPKLLLKKSAVSGRLVLVTSIHFKDHIQIGDPISQAKIYQAQAADELIFIDIEGVMRENRSELADILRRASEEIFMPVTMGGFVQSMDDFRFLFLSGADKVSINSAAVKNPNLINEASDAYGAQCVILSIDYRKMGDEYKVFIECGNAETELDPVAWAIEGERLGAGEILLTSIDRDGTKTGLDIELTRKVAAAVSIPVIASGGCGLASHFVDGFRDGKADGVSAGTFFSFKDQNPMQTRAHIKSGGVPIRLHV